MKSDLYITTIFRLCIVWELTFYMLAYSGDVGAQHPGVAKYPEQIVFMVTATHCIQGIFLCKNLRGRTDG